MYKEIKKGVYYFNETSPYVDINSIQFLKEECKKNNLNMSRLCLHKNSDANLMSMLIVVIDKFVYPVHKHPWKDESYSLIQGEALYEEYDEKGLQILSKKMTVGSSLLNNSKNFHAIIPLTNVIAFMENTIGPFQENKLKYLSKKN